MRPLSELKGTFFQFFAAITANLMAITEGMAMGWTAPMIPYFVSEQSHIKMTQTDAEWMETWLLIGAISGVFSTMFIIHKIGTKKSLLGATFLLVWCWVVIAVANRKEYIYIARFVKGVGLNAAYVSATMYVGEISDKSIRGFLSSNAFIMSLVGIILIYSIGPFVPFYVPSIIAAVLLTVEIVIFSFMPESPYYLIQKNQHEQARKSLQMFRSGTDIETELKEITEAREIDQKEKVKLQDIFVVKNYRKAILIMLVLNFAQPFSSFEVILMNLHVILESAGSTDIIKPSSIAIIYSIINLIAAITASCLMDKLGRKTLLIISSILSGFCVFTLAVYYNLRYIGYDVTNINWLPVVSVLVYACVYKLGMGMVPIVMAAEIFASKIKTIGMSIADGIYMVAITVAVQVFFILRDLFGMHVPFYLFSCCSFLTCVYVLFCLPETKGKSLDEIQQILKYGKSSVDVKSNKDAFAMQTTNGC